MMTMKDLRKLDKDWWLHRVGLEERSPTSDFFSGLGLFAVGVLVGAGLGLMFAPKRGDEMRNLMTDAWKSRRPGGQQDYSRELGMEASTTAGPMGGGHA